MTAGIRHEDLRRRNRAMVLSSMRRMGKPSRTEIAAVTGLSNSTISAISAGLLQEGLLLEGKSEAASAKRGRPQVALELNPSACAIVAVVLSLNSLSAALIDYAGSVVMEDHKRIPTLTLEKDALVAELLEVIRSLLRHRKEKARRVIRISIAIQGITDCAEGTMLWSPITAHTDIPFGRLVEAEFGIPCTIENDCNMIAVALRWRAPERFRDNFVSLLLSNGIGMGLFLKGQLFTGTRSSGGEFGHMMHRPGGALCRCGQRGCIEAYAGNYAIWRNARGGGDEDLPMADIGQSEMRQLADAARDHDGPERQAYRRAGEAIGFGLGSLFALIDPAPVMIVGAGAEAFDLLEGPLREAIARTVGGQYASDLAFETEPKELPLTREGCAMHALTFIDNEILANGPLPMERTKAA